MENTTKLNFQKNKINYFTSIIKSYAVPFFLASTFLLDNTGTGQYQQVETYAHADAHTSILRFPAEPLTY